MVFRLLPMRIYRKQCTSFYFIVSFLSSPPSTHRHHRHRHRHWKLSMNLTLPYKSCVLLEHTYLRATILGSATKYYVSMDWNSVTFLKLFLGWRNKSQLFNEQHIITYKNWIYYNLKQWADAFTILTTTTTTSLYGECWKPIECESSWFLTFSILLSYCCKI